MSVMHSGIDSRRVCLFRLHLCKKKNNEVRAHLFQTLNSFYLSCFLSNLNINKSYVRNSLIFLRDHISEPVAGLYAFYMRSFLFKKVTITKHWPVSSPNISYNNLKVILFITIKLDFILKHTLMKSANFLSFCINF